MKKLIEQISEKLEKLFVNRDDTYAEAYLNKDKTRMAYGKKEGIIDKYLIEEHLERKRTLGIYQLKGSRLKWACGDFDLNTEEDFENAKKLYEELKKQGLHPQAELSGGGDYKIHIWIFCDCEAKDIKYYLEDICEKIKVMPHEIFPKQEQADKTQPYGNLVKLPLGLHLVTKKRSTFLDDDFKEIKTLDEISKILDYHLKNIDIIPKIIIKEKIIKEFQTAETKQPNEFDNFFNFVLRNELPSGKSAKEKKYQKIVGVNDNILKNLAIWFFKKGYTLEQLEEEVKPIYDTNGWAFGDLKGWFKKASNKDDNNFKQINPGEMAEYCIQAERKDLLELIPQEQEVVEYKKIKLAELNASLVNDFVEVNCQITGEQSQKAIPDKIKITCETCGKDKIFNCLEFPEMFIGEVQLKTFLEDLKKKFMCDCVYAEVEEGEQKPKPYKTTKINRYVDYSVLYVRDLLDRESLSAVKRYEPKRVYVINQLLPNAKKVNIQGRVFIEPKTKNISIVCNSIKHLESQVEDFKITEEFKENSKKYFNSGENVYKQINPDIVGKPREIAKQSLILQLHSPCKIYDITRKKLIRGGLNIIFYGDTKCGKSDIAKDITQRGSMPLGEYTICETGGRTGFLYTIDRDKNALIWGSLALNDMGLVVLDGLQSMHSEELGEFREAIEQQEIIVRRSISGEALCRTRILGSLNPNKPMANYIYRCQGLQDTYVFSKSPEFTRWDLFIPFSQRDVSGKEIAHRQSEDKPIPEDIFMQHIYWAWSRKPEQIIYTESAVKKINDLSEQFIENYSLENLPIVHNGIRDIITRLSVAVACQTHSTDETQEKIIVETEHVEKAVNWYMQILDMLELARYKQDTEGKSELTDNDCIAITKELGETEWQILEEIKHEQKNSTQLSAVLDKSIDTVKEHYKLLKKHNLIETKTGQGISLSVRGVKFVRWGMLNPGGLEDKTPTNKNDSGKNTHQPTTNKKGLDKWSVENKAEIKEVEEYEDD